MNRLDIILKLIELGKDSISLEEIRPMRVAIELDGINRAQKIVWFDLFNRFPDDEILFLFKGLVIAENDLELTGGSVSGTVWILRYLDKVLSPRTIYELINWSLRVNTFNSYCPLGGYKLLDTHLSEGERLSNLDSTYLQALEVADRTKNNRRKTLIENQKIIEHEEGYKARFEKINEHLRKSNEIRESFKKEMDIISGLSPIDRLDHLVRSKLPISAFPKDLYDLGALSQSYSGNPPIEAIRQRLHSYKGHWLKLLKILESISQ